MVGNVLKNFLLFYHITRRKILEDLHSRRRQNLHKYM
jgi:hypothetical protein